MCVGEPDASIIVVIAVNGIVVCLLLMTAYVLANMIEGHVAVMLAHKATDLIHFAVERTQSLKFAIAY